MNLLRGQRPSKSGAYCIVNSVFIKYKFKIEMNLLRGQRPSKSGSSATAMTSSVSSITIQPSIAQALKLNFVNVENSSFDFKKVT